MTKPTIVTRVGKGAPLSITEGDSNFTNLRDATIGVLANGTTVSTDLNGSFEIEAGSGITVTGNNSTKKITIANSQTAFSGAYNDLTGKPTLFSGVYSDLTGKPTNVSSFTNDAGYITSVTSALVTNALGYSPESSANKNQANGYVGLDSSSKISATYLPSYVDDVLEAANYAGLPGTGESGKIYVTLDTNKTYRWSGSAYIEISASPGTTDALTEGTTNFYFTQTRARAAVSASGDLSYNATTGVFTYSTPTTIASLSNHTTNDLSEGTSNFYFTQTRARAAVSASGDLSYNATTGVFSYTGISYPTQTGNSGKYLTTDGTNVSWATVSSGWSGTASSDLNMAGYAIKGTSAVVKFGDGAGTANLSSNGAYALKLSTDSNSGSSAFINILSGTNANIGITPSGTGKVMLNGPLGLTATSGTPATYNTSYFEGTLDTPAAWFKVSVGGSDYYLPMFQ